MQLFYAIFNVYRSQVDPKAKVRCAVLLLRCVTLRLCCPAGHGAVRLVCLGASPFRTHPMCAGAGSSINPAVWRCSLHLCGADHCCQHHQVRGACCRRGPCVLVSASAIDQQHMFRCLQLLHASPLCPPAFPSCPHLLPCYPPAPPLPQHHCVQDPPVLRACRRLPMHDAMRAGCASAAAAPSLAAHTRPTNATLHCVYVSLCVQP